MGWPMMFHPHPPPLASTLVSGIDLLTQKGGAEVAVSVRIEQKGDVRIPRVPVRERPPERRRGPVRLGHDDKSAGGTVEAVHGVGG